MTPRSPSQIPWKLQKTTIRQPGSDSRRPTFSAESRSLVAISLIGIGGESDQDQDNRPPREKRIPLDVQLPSTAFPKRQCRFDQYGVDPYSSAKIKLEEPLHPPTLKPKDSDYHPTNVAPAHQYSNPRVTGFQYPFQWGGSSFGKRFCTIASQSIYLVDTYTNSTASVPHGTPSRSTTTALHDTSSRAISSNSSCRRTNC